MKIFISWSGHRSLLVAQKLKELLPLILHSCEVYLSTEMRKGTLWSAQIVRELGRFNAAIACITPDTIRSPWMAFELGAIAKPSRKNKKPFVCTYLIGETKLGTRSPLSMFQATRANRSDTLRMIRDLNSAMEQPVPEHQLKMLFDVLWRRLANAIAEAGRPAA